MWFYSLLWVRNCSGVDQKCPENSRTRVRNTRCEVNWNLHFDSPIKRLQSKNQSSLTVILTISELIKELPNVIEHLISFLQYRRAVHYIVITVIIIIIIIIIITITIIPTGDDRKNGSVTGG